MAAGGGLDADFGRIFVNGFDRLVKHSSEICRWTLANSPTLIAAREEDGRLAVEVQLGGLRPIPRSLLGMIEVGFVLLKIIYWVLKLCVDSVVGLSLQDTLSYVNIR